MDNFHEDLNLLNDKANNTKNRNNNLEKEIEEMEYIVDNTFLHFDDPQTDLPKKLNYLLKLMMSKINSIPKNEFGEGELNFNLNKTKNDKAKEEIQEISYILYKLIGNNILVKNENPSLVNLNRKDIFIHYQHRLKIFIIPKNMLKKWNSKE